MHARHEDRIKFVTALGDAMPHSFEDSADLRFENIGWDTGSQTGFVQDGGVCITVQRDTGKRHLKADDPLDRSGDGIEMNAIAAAQERPVDVEEIRVLLIPGEPRFN